MPVDNTNTIIIIVVCCCILSIILSLGLYYYYYYVLTTPAPSVQTSSPVQNASSSIQTASPTSSIQTTSPTSSIQTASPTSSIQTASPTSLPTIGTTQSFYTYTNTDISGNDMTCYQSPNMTSNQCYNECVNDPNCVAYNNIPAGFNSTFVNQGCCKKNALTNTVASNGITLYTKN